MLLTLPGLGAYVNTYVKKCLFLLSFRTSHANSEEPAEMITKDPAFPIPASLSKTEVTMQETKPETISAIANEQDGSSRHETPLAPRELDNRCVCPVNTKVDTDLGNEANVQTGEVLRESGSVQQTSQLQTGVNEELPKPPASEADSIAGNDTATPPWPRAVIGEGDYIHML